MRTSTPSQYNLLSPLPLHKPVVVVAVVVVVVDVVVIFVVTVVVVVTVVGMHALHMTGQRSSTENPLNIVSLQLTPASFARVTRSHFPVLGFTKKPAGAFTAQ